MGGSAFLIYGELDADRAAAAPRPSSFFDRFRRRKPASITEVQLPNGRSLLEFPADAIKQPLAQDYLAFVRDRLPAPSAASRVVLDYLKHGQPTIYLRSGRDASGGTGPWYVQVTFSGLAGMCETSARVAAHWADSWFAARADVIRGDVLAPAGFTAMSGKPLAETAFVPTREYGYAEREEGTFAIDAGFLDSHPDPDRLLKELEQEYGQSLADGTCHCEMCRRR